MSNTGSELSNFRTSNRIQSISSKADYLLNKLQDAEQKTASLIISQNYLDYLTNYFKCDTLDNDILAPAIYQTANQLFAGQIQKIMELNTEMLAVSKPLGESVNPVVEQLKMELELAKNVLLTTIANQKEVLKEEIKRVNSEKLDYEQALYSLPETERKLLGIERKFQLNNEVYTFFIKKKIRSTNTKSL